jgi:hypothetical protein
LHATTPTITVSDNNIFFIAVFFLIAANVLIYK